MNKAMRALDVTTSLLASSLRGWRGSDAFTPAVEQPSEPLQLYEFEACPYCRRVREALTELDLDALILPCPQGGTRFRPDAAELGGKAQFPFLVDPNTQRLIYESSDIIDYLTQTYGGRASRIPAPLQPLSVTAGGLASLSRGLRGGKSNPSRQADVPLELYSFESSPFSRLVRERLCELEIPYLLRNTGKALWKDMGPPSLRRRFFPGTPVEGRNRKRLLALTGRVQVPYLIDPNTGIEMFESQDIINYLNREYAA